MEWLPRKIFDPNTLVLKSKVAISLNTVELVWSMQYNTVYCSNVLDNEYTRKC